MIIIYVIKMDFGKKIFVIVFMVFMEIFVNLKIFVIFWIVQKMIFVINLKIVNLSVNR